MPEEIKSRITTLVAAAIVAVGCSTIMGCSSKSSADSCDDKDCGDLNCYTNDDGVAVCGTCSSDSDCFYNKDESGSCTDNFCSCTSTTGSCTHNAICQNINNASTKECGITLPSITCGSDMADQFYHTCWKGKWGGAYAQYHFTAENSAPAKGDLVAGHSSMSYYEINQYNLQSIYLERFITWSFPDDTTDGDKFTLNLWTLNSRKTAYSNTATKTFTRVDSNCNKYHVAGDSDNYYMDIEECGCRNMTSILAPAQILHFLYSGELQFHP